MTALPQELEAPPDDEARLAVRAANLNAAYDDLEARAILRRAIADDFPGRLAVVSSFGAESAVLLDLVASIDRAVPVIFVDTGKLFWETRNYRDLLTSRLGLTDVRSVEPAWHDLARFDPDGGLHRRDPDLCCNLRKVRPLEQALAGFDAWITGRKRFHGFERSALPFAEADGGKVKINPLARWTQVELSARFVERGLPYHPLVAAGYASIGCQPCTDRVGDGDSVRAGRWAGSEKTECGIHRAPWAAAAGLAP